MKKEIEAQVKSKLAVLMGPPIPEAMYHRGIVMISHDFLGGDYRRELIDFPAPDSLGVLPGS